MYGVADKNKKEITWKAKQIEVDGVKYAYNPKTNEVFDLDSYKNGDAVKVGIMLITDEGSEGKKYKLEFI